MFKVSIQTKSQMEHTNEKPSDPTPVPSPELLKQINSKRKRIEHDTRDLKLLEEKYKQCKESQLETICAVITEDQPDEHMEGKGAEDSDDSSEPDADVPLENNNDRLMDPHELVQALIRNGPGGGNLLNSRRHVEKKPAVASKKPKEKRVRASKLEHKKLDELWSKTKHDYYLAESSPSPNGLHDDWEEYLFIVRRKFDWYNKPQKTYVDIKSPLLRDIIREVLQGIHGVSVREEKPSVENTILFNFLPQLQAQYLKLKESPAEGQNELAAKHMEVLIEYLSSAFAPTARLLYPLLAHEEITFDLLWALFLPNTLVYTTCPGTRQPRCVKLDWSDYKRASGRTWYQLECHFVDYDGKQYKNSTVSLEIDTFYGAQPIDSLSSFPLAYLADEAEVREKLIERGRKFVQLGGMHHKLFDGPAFVRQKEPPSIRRINVNGRVMIDTKTFRRINPDYENIGKDQNRTAVRILRSGDMPELDILSSEDDSGAEVEDVNPQAVDKAEQTDADESSERTFDITARPQRLYQVGADKKLELKVLTPKGEAKRKTIARQSSSRANILDPKNLVDEQLLICSPTVMGFSLVDKHWLEFSISHLADIAFSPNAFESLVLPESKKSLVKALVQDHVSGTSNTVDDVISGKGRGLVAVLHGNPGVGKTLTAEGIADHLRRPLYMVSAGELGINAETLEKRLTNILDISYTWNAVLLIDEADVFLERRSVHDLHRNSLVSIFLRVLEYFQGILFLTTNRVEIFDEAFQSRIHIALRYENLDRKAQATIWSSFLNRVSKDEIPEENRDTTKPREIITKGELERICRRDLNGRQIKNAVRSAQVIAASLKEQLSFKHINMVLDITQAFEHDLKGTGQLDSMMSYA